MCVCVCNSTRLHEYIRLCGTQYIGCNNGVGCFHLNLVSFERTDLPLFSGLKKCASKNAVLRCNKKSGKSARFYTKRKSGGKIPHIRPSPK